MADPPPDSRLQLQLGGLIIITLITAADKMDAETKEEEEEEEAGRRNGRRSHGASGGIYFPPAVGKVKSPLHFFQNSGLPNYWLIKMPNKNRQGKCQTPYLNHRLTGISQCKTLYKLLNS